MDRVVELGARAGRCVMRVAEGYLVRSRLPQNTQRSEVSAMAERARRGEGQGAWQQTQSVRGRCWWEVMVGHNVGRWALRRRAASCARVQI